MAWILILEKRDITKHLQQKFNLSNQIKENALDSVVSLVC